MAAKRWNILVNDQETSSRRRLARLDWSRFPISPWVGVLTSASFYHYLSVGLVDMNVRVPGKWKEPALALEPHVIPKVALRTLRPFLWVEERTLLLNSRGVIIIIIR